MTSPLRRELLRGLLGIGLCSALGGCGPSDTAPPPGEPAAAAPTPGSPAGNPRLKLDSRKASAPSKAGAVGK
jgi:hypothetical protein